MKNLCFAVQISLLLLSLPAFSQFRSNGDTTAFNKKNFRDSLSIKKLIDTVYAHKDENPVNLIRFCDYAYNRASEIRNWDLQGNSVNVKGGIFADLGDYKNALNYNYQALRFFEKTKNQYSIPMTINNIGRDYWCSGKLKDALKYLEKAET